MLPRFSSHSPAIGPGVTGPAVAVPQPDIVANVPSNHPHNGLNSSESFLVDPALLCPTADEPRKHTQYPYVTGTSVVGVKFRDGVLVACDMLGSYGSTKRYKSVQRLYQVNEHCVIGASGEISDFQYIKTLLDELDTNDYCEEYGIKLTPKEVYAYLTRVMYNRRNKFDPLWNSIVVGGVQDGAPFLATVGMIGVHYEDDHVATGFANHLGRPLLRESWQPDMSEDEAMQLLNRALRVCYYRDKQSINKFQVARVAANGVKISEPFALDTKWDYKLFEHPAAFAVGAW